MKRIVPIFIVLTIIFTCLTSTLAVNTDYSEQTVDDGNTRETFIMYGFQVTYDLQHVISSNMDRNAWTNYSTVLSPNQGYVITEVSAVMGNKALDVAENADGTYTVSVSQAIDNIIITAKAVSETGDTESEVISNTEPSAEEPEKTEDISKPNEYTAPTLISVGFPVEYKLNRVRSSNNITDAWGNYNTVLSPEEGFAISYVSASIDDEKIDVINNGDGTYTIDIGVIKGKLVIVADAVKEAYLPTEITLKASSTVLFVGQKTKIDPIITNGKGKTVFKSSKKYVASVDKNGLITARKNGIAKISVENNGVKKEFIVIVKNPKLNKNKITLKKGKSFTLKITGKVGTAKFSSNKKSVAAVNKNGKITAKKKGKAFITVKTNGITLKANVTVK